MDEFVVVCDVDSTLINEEVIDLLADAAGVGAEVESITRRAMDGELDFTESLRARVALLAGFPVDGVARVGQSITLTNGANELVEAVHKAGGRIIAVSGGFHEVLDGLGGALGLDGWTANRLETKDGLLTGRVDGEIVDAQAKADALVKYAEGLDIPLSRTIVVGDGANDLAMMDRAGLSVAFCAKPVVAQRADIALTTRDLRLVASLFGRLG